MQNIESQVQQQHVADNSAEAWGKVKAHFTERAQAAYEAASTSVSSAANVTVLSCASAAGNVAQPFEALAPMAEAAPAVVEQTIDSVSLSAAMAAARYNSVQASARASVEQTQATLRAGQEYTANQYSYAEEVVSGAVQEAAAAKEAVKGAAAGTTVAVVGAATALPRVARESALDAQRAVAERAEATAEAAAALPAKTQAYLAEQAAAAQEASAEAAASVQTSASARLGQVRDAALAKLDGWTTSVLLSLLPPKPEKAPLEDQALGVPTGYVFDENEELAC